MLSLEKSDFSRHSFTLVELLIVVAIIGLLVAFAVPGFSAARAKSRDARRMADLKQIANALELAYATNSAYPNPTATACLSTCVADSPPAWCTNLLAQIPNIPNDPLPNQQCYLYNSDGTNFRIAAKLESSSSYTSSQGDGGLYPQFFEAYSSFSSILLSAYKSVWPSSGLSNLDPNYSSLLGWWNFEEGTGGAGATTVDDSGSGNNGTLSATPPTWQISGCGSGGCLNFDGTNKNYVQASSAISTPSAFTVSVWWKRLRDSGGTNSTHHLIAAAINGSGGYNLFLIPKAGSSILTTVNVDGVSKNATASISDTTVFSHIVMVWDGSFLTAYVNGASGAPTAASGALASGPSKFLTGKFGSSYYANGLVDDMRIYNRALNAKEICHICREMQSASFCNNCSE
ncbi:MAG: prepilin-type N-terminal cleavage/methylation domain-containing protein [Patescibacteria group bacterium]|nr:prepilin-type N-terminal cleavage/methylation domain-containing protein [Patescibacteria group bacterium]MDD5121371.1 prepilin-type N-terminal cleavage/methylation domain-containing protein [Patescibacteria group bacterium]MDD5221778.1 prepilin-type N-terminal cleavage/methylation domain-containing protein [Patescibacteria group bacterium]MDD5395710.1 prepilin-type N-terminal cleavage/methylation domain-containing protein [Patescibacteria group bacterium]